MHIQRAETISAVIVLAFTGYFGYDFYLNYQQGVSKIQEDYRTSQQTQEFRTQLAESLHATEVIQQRLAPEATSEWLLERVNALAKEAGIEIASATPYPPRQVDSFIQPSVSLQVATSYHRLGKFLSILESAQPVVRVDEMDIARGEDAVHPAAVRLTLSTVYAPALNP